MFQEKVQTIRISHTYVCGKAEENENMARNINSNGNQRRRRQTGQKLWSSVKSIAVVQYDHLVQLQLTFECGK